MFIMHIMLPLWMQIKLISTLCTLPRTLKTKLDGPDKSCFLSQTILFKPHREGEMRSMPLSMNLSGNTTNSHHDVDWVLTEVGKTM